MDDKQKSARTPSGHSGRSATDFIDAMQLPEVTSFDPFLPCLTDYPDFVPPCSLNEPGNPHELQEYSEASRALREWVPESSDLNSKAAVAQSVRASAMSALEAISRLENRTAVLKAKLIGNAIAANQLEATAHGLDTTQRSLSETSTISEIALSLRIPERTAASLTHYAVDLPFHPETLTAAENGELSWSHVTTVLSESQTLAETAGISHQQLGAFEHKLLELVEGTTAAAFASKARRLREGTHPASLAMRTRQAIRKRELSLEHGKDGMSWIGLHIPATAAEGIWVQCTRIARQLQTLQSKDTWLNTFCPEQADTGASQGLQAIHQPGRGQRTLTQLRADVAASLLLGQTSALPENAVAHHAPAHQQNLSHKHDPVLNQDSTEQPDSGLQQKLVLQRNEGREQGPLLTGARNHGDHRSGPYQESPQSSGQSGYCSSQTASVAPADRSKISLIGAPESPITTLARSLQRGLVDGIPEETAAECIAQYLVELDATRRGLAVAEPPEPSAQIIVTVPVLSLLGTTDQPAELAGYGPISPVTARKLLTKASSFLRVLTDPITGKPLDLQPDRYRLRSHERTLLNALGESCSWLNCSTPAIPTEADHIASFANGGTTTLENLQPLCRRHHALKHLKDDKTRTGEFRRLKEPSRNGIRLSGWSARITSDGGTGWTTPTGRYHPPQKKIRIPTHLPRWLSASVD